MTQLKRYELRTKVAEGGFGAVYRAFDPLLNREVAVKVILPQFANIPSFIRRFEAEARIVARLEHPHIVPLYDYWRDPSGAYLVMRWMPGGSLRRDPKASLLLLDLVARIFDQVADALVLAHQGGVLHRDLKPANILCDTAGNAFLADFGIAKELDRTDTTALSELLAYTPGYAAPEQILAAPATPQSDIYSLGVVLYELLTGVSPFEGATPHEVVSQQLDGQFATLTERRPDLPPSLDAVIRRATAREPADRYSDVTRFRAEVHHAFAVLPAHSGAPGDASPYATVALETPEIANPYKGLRAFQEADADDFFGRAALSRRLLARMAETTPEDAENRAQNHQSIAHPPVSSYAQARFLAVVGPSGSGKSSVVRAGLLPALRRGELAGSQRWFIVDILPSAYPLEKLEAALLRVAVNPPASLLEQLRADERGLLRAVNRVLPADESVELVLVIDQFEELFTLVEDEAVRVHLLNSLLVALSDPDSRLRVIATLRADFYDRPLLYAGFGELMRRRTEVVLPLTPAELEQAIVGPAARVGIKVEPDLVATMVRDVGEQPGTLPLLQYALTELFEQRAGRSLLLSAYQASGGVQGSLARRADELYDHLDDAGKEATRQLFLRLVTLGEGVEDTRRRVRLAEFGDWRVEAEPQQTTAQRQFLISHPLDVYGRYRLLTFDHDPISREPTVEVAHEALIRSWGRLRDWLDSSRERLRVQRRLAAAAAEWQQAEHDSSFLATGARLAQFTALATEGNLALNAGEQTFLEVSRQALAEQESRAELARQAELAQAQELAEAQRRRAEVEAAAGQRLRRRAMLLAGALLVALVALLAAGGFGFRAEQSASEARAAQEQTKAQLNVVDTQRLAFAAQALAPIEHETALLLAYEAAARDVNPVTARVLRETYAETSWWSTIFKHDGDVYSAAFSPDGQRILTGSKDTTARLWDLKGKQLAILQGHTATVRFATFRADGQRILTASEDNTARLWDADGNPLATLQGHTAMLYRAIFSPDGQRIVTASADSTARLWDAEGNPLAILTGHTKDVYRVAFSPDSQRIVTASGDGTARLWDADGGEFGVLRGHTNEVMGVAFSPDGQRIATTSRDETARLWNLTGNQVALLDKAAVLAIGPLTFSPDGQNLLIGTRGLSALVWNLADPAAQSYKFLNQNAEVISSAFSPDGQRIVLGAGDGTVQMYELSDVSWLNRGTLYHGARVNSVAFSSDGRQVLTASWDGTARLWAPSRRRVIADTSQRTIIGTAFPESEQRFVTIMTEFRDGQSFGETQLWGTDGQLISTLVPNAVPSAGFSEDGHRIFLGGGDGVGRLFDANGKPIAEMRGHTVPIGTFAITDDGRRIITCAIFTNDADKTARLWDDSGKQIAVLNVGDEKVFDAKFSPDGQRIATGSKDKMARVWDAQGQLLATLQGHENTVLSVAFSPDGQRIVTASFGRTARLWDISGRLLATMSGHNDVVHDVRFSPDGSFILTQGGDATVRLWDSNGKWLATLQHNVYVGKVDISPDSKFIVTSDNEAVRLWDVAGNALAVFRGYPGNNLSSGIQVGFSVGGDEILVTDNGWRWRYPLQVDSMLQTLACRLPRNLTEQEIARFEVSQPLRFDIATRQCPT